jgi:hypothetical protein
MIHHSTEHRPLGDHYAASYITNPAPHLNAVLAQVSQDGNQARVALTPEEARHFAQLLLAAADTVETYLATQKIL